MEASLDFNMSWIFVDGIDQDALYDALDAAATITEYWYGRWVADDFFRNLQTLLLTSLPPKL
jgi:hypothetical protein